VRRGNIIIMFRFCQEEDEGEEEVRRGVWLCCLKKLRLEAMEPSSPLLRSKSVDSGKLRRAKNRLHSLQSLLSLSTLSEISETHFRRSASDDPQRKRTHDLFKGLRLESAGHFSAPSDLETFAYISFDTRVWGEIVYFFARLKDPVRN